MIHRGHVQQLAQAVWLAEVQCTHMPGSTHHFITATAARCLLAAASNACVCCLGTVAIWALVSRCAACIAIQVLAGCCVGVGLCATGKKFWQLMPRRQVTFAGTSKLFEAVWLQNITSVTVTVKKGR
jgi:hypothetical protein